MKEERGPLAHLTRGTTLLETIKQKECGKWERFRNEIIYIILYILHHIFNVHHIRSSRLKFSKKLNFVIILENQK